MCEGGRDNNIAKYYKITFSVYKDTYFAISHKTKDFLGGEYLMDGEFDVPEETDPFDPSKQTQYLLEWVGRGAHYLEIYGY